jgi:hypothetical protein
MGLLINHIRDGPKEVSYQEKTSRPKSLDLKIPKNPNVGYRPGLHSHSQDSMNIKPAARYEHISASSWVISKTFANHLI